jgi:hypothetical protein
MAKMHLSLMVVSLFGLMRLSWWKGIFTYAPCVKRWPSLRLYCQLIVWFGLSLAQLKLGDFLELNMGVFFGGECRSQEIYQP